MSIIVVLILLAIVAALIPKPTKSNRKAKKFGEGMFSDINAVDQSFSAGKDYRP
jgi:hypothetical protein